MKTGYKPQSFPTISPSQDAFSQDNPASELAVFLARYGVEKAGLVAQSFYDLSVNRSVTAILDLLRAVGNDKVSSVGYGIKSAILDRYDPTEIASDAVACEGLSEWREAIRSPNGLSQTMNTSPPNPQQAVESPKAILNWASAVDPQNRGVYQSVRQGAFVDACWQLILQQTRRDVSKLYAEYQTLRFAVARGTYKVPRGDDQQSPIDTTDIPIDSVQASSNNADQSSQAKPKIKSLTVLDPYKEGRSELKTGDTVFIKGLANKPLATVETLGIKAFTQQEYDTSGKRFSLNAQIDARGILSPQAKTSRLRATSEDGTEVVFDLAEFDGPKLVLNDVEPSFQSIDINYPSGQSAVTVGQSLSITPIGQGFDSFQVETEDFEVAQSQGIASLKPKAKLSREPDTEYPITVILSRQANGKSLRLQRTINLERSTPVLTTSDTDLKYDDDGVTNIVKLSFDQAVQRVGLAEPLPIGKNLGFEGATDSWQQLISLSSGDAADGSQWQYRIRSVSLAGIETLHTVTLTVIGHV